MPAKLTNLICPNQKCKEEINEPILLTDFSKTPTESYYACPRCMTKLKVASEAKKVPEMIPITAQEMPEEEKEETSEEVEPEKTKEKPARPSESKEETPPECPHYLGYLSKRPKNAPIPEECLTCRKMIKCMLKL